MESDRGGRWYVSPELDWVVVGYCGTSFDSDWVDVGGVKVG